MTRKMTNTARSMRQQHRAQLINTTQWLLRGIVVLWIVQTLVPAAPRAPLPPPEQVQTERPLVCVHTHFTNEVEEWKIQRSMQLIREMGAATIVEFFLWAYIESTEDHYDWASVDRVVRHAQNQGIRIIARLGIVPAWARETDDDQPTRLNYLPEESFADFAEFVGDFAARYAGSIDHIIIWNEPNLAFEWGYTGVDVGGYVRLLQAVHAPAHAANPNVRIIAAGLAPTLEPLGSPNGLNDLLYLEQLYAAGAAAYFDALAIHTYGFIHPPQQPPARDRLNFRRAELLREIMEQHGDGATPVYITETGWNDHPRWTQGVRPAQRIIYTLDALTLTEQNWTWVENICIWYFRTPTLTYSYPDNFAIVTPDFQLRPIYYALQAYARGWDQEDVQWLPPPEP